MDYQKAREIMAKHIGMNGRMITGSKTLYDSRNPDHIIVFNANVFADGLGKIWFGDLDITLDSQKLYFASKEIGVNLYVLREHDGRFDKENNPDYKKVAVWNTFNS